MPKGMQMSDDTQIPAADTSVADTTADVAITDSTTATDVVEGEGQGDADKAADKVETKDAVVDSAPEKYESFDLPEGFTLEGDRLEAVTEFAKANNWTQERAQAGVTEYLKLRGAELEMQRGDWAVQSEAEFGKEFPTITAGAQRALVALEAARPGITDRLDATNLGNHPDVLYLVNQLGQHLKAKPMAGMENDTAGSQDKSLQSRMYPGMK